MVKNIKQNKYKLLLGVIVLLLCIDIFLHKGIVRTLLPKKFSSNVQSNVFPLPINGFIRKEKSWTKSVNTKENFAIKASRNFSIEIDIYYDAVKNIFDVHHDPENSVGINFEDLLFNQNQQKFDGSIWIDFKNLSEGNAINSLKLLMQLRLKYQLQNKILVESSNISLLKGFSDNGFYTAYYTPYFNPYLGNDSENIFWADSISKQLRKYPVHAISGYYFQKQFLQNNFPNFPILLWAPNDKWSVINQFYKYKINIDTAVFIALYDCK